MRRAVAAPAALGVAVAATGWLYVMRPYLALPGPRVGDALPLDELSKRSAVPLPLYVAAWLVAGLTLGAITRWARFERLTAAVLLALGVGMWTYLADGVSIATVRQIPARDAFETAATLQAVYVAAAAAAVGGALLAPSVRCSRRAPLVLASVVFAAGALDVLHGVLPPSSTGLSRMSVDAIAPLSRALVAPIGLALMIAARGLARRRRRAWQVALCLLALASAIHLVHGFDIRALASASIAIALVARRAEFDRPGDVATRRVLVSRAAVAVAVIAAYGVGALWLNRMVADQPFTLGFAWREIGAGLLGLHAHGSPHLAGHFGHWFPLSLLVMGLAATAWVVSAWLAPWRYRLGQEARERELARRLVVAWGADTLAPFVRRADKSYFFADDDRALLAYRVVGGVAIVSGDPIGPPDALPELLARFVAFAHERDWRVAILGASERCLPLYRAHGLRALYHGDEAIVDTRAFTLDGRSIRKVRQSNHRLEHAGFTIDVRYPSEIDDALRDELEAIAAAWRGTEPERGFVMALDALFRLDDEDALFVVGRDANGRPAGFLHFAVTPAGSALSLSSMPRRRDTPNGFNEWLICAAIEWAREHGFERVSLNFAPFAAVLAPEAELTPVQEMQRRALRAL
jgi:lysyl-tRNA synthetase, class II